MRWPQVGEMIYLHPRAELTDADIAEAAAGLNGDRHEVLVRFTRAGGQKLSRLYDTRCDKLLAILVDGRVVCAFQLADRVTERAAISGGFTAAEVDRLVELLNNR